MRETIVIKNILLYPNLLILKRKYTSCPNKDKVGWTFEMLQLQ